MVTLEQMKLFLHMDYELTDEDDAIKGMMAAAIAYIEEATGCTDTDAPLFELAEKLIVACWFDGGDVVSTTEIPLSAQSVLNHMKLMQEGT